MHLPSKRPPAAAGGGGGRGPMGTWAARLGVALLVLIATVQLISVQMVSQPGLPSAISSSSSSSSRRSDPCFDRHLRDPNDTNLSVLEEEKPLVVPSPTVYPPRREYKSNGYLLLHCNGGLNQMRAAICDMVTIARHLNITLVIPELDKQSFWADPSDFEDIFDVDHFIKSLRDEVKIVKRIPPKVLKRIPDRKYPSMQPKSWSNLDYYINEILPLIRKHKILKFEKTDTRLANNGIPLERQKLRCRVNYDALRFKPQIEELGAKLISILRKHKSFVGLHLRYEMDMLAFSGCTKECSDEEIKELTSMRYAISWWKEKEIDSVKKREDGLCPLTPKETALVLKALGFGRDTQIYIAAGDIYGGERRLAPLRAEYPNIVKKEMLLTVEELTPYRNHSNQMAALDYLVSVASDVFLPTYGGNMAKVVVGHRRYNGFLQSVMLDKLNLVPLLDLYENQTLSWDQFSSAMNAIHEDRMGQPTLRNVVPGEPKLEDYFYANPHECLAQEI